MFQRSKNTVEKQILIDGLETDVIRDARVTCGFDGHVYFEKVQRAGNGQNYSVLVPYKVQFPKHLREPNKVYITDLKLEKREGRVSFYSAYKGTIRDVDGKLVG